VERDETAVTGVDDAGQRGVERVEDRLTQLLVAAEHRHEDREADDERGEDREQRRVRDATGQQRPVGGAVPPERAGDPGLLPPRQQPCQPALWCGAVRAVVAVGVRALGHWRLPPQRSATSRNTSTSRQIPSSPYS